MSDVSPCSDSVEVIREGLRQNVAFERKEHRITEINKNRVALGEIPEDKSFTPEFVTELAKSLKKKSLSTKDYQYLQNALIQSEENVIAFLKVDNVLAALARDLSSNKISAQLSAASCCCNIALGNKKACTALTKYMGPYLLLNLESLNRPLVEVCAWTIGNLTAGSSTAFTILYTQGCTRHLLSLISNCDDPLLPSLIYATMHWVYSGSQHISETELVDLIKILINRNIIYYNTDSVWLLALLSSSTICCKYLKNILPTIMDYLYCSAGDEFPNASEVTASVRIVGNTMYELDSNEITTILLRNGKSSKEELSALLYKLLSHQRNHIRKETIWMIANLYVLTNDSQVLKDIIQSLPLEVIVSSIS